MNDNINQVVKERNVQYADAWGYTGVICAIPHVRGGLELLLKQYAQMFFPWVMILNKLLRVLGSPNNQDHWTDIAGYAMLVLKDLQGGANENDIPSK